MNSKLTAPIIWSTAAVGVVGYVTLWPTEYRIPCALNHFTGLECPGCGTTRALASLVEGDLAAAFSFNQLIFFIPLFFVALYLAKRSRYQKQLEVLLITLAGLAALAYFVFRNDFL
jgi:hypothetical protein